jgi:hypothetical protein
VTRERDGDGGCDESGWRRDLNLLLTKRLFASQCRSSFFNLEYQSCLWCKQTYDDLVLVRFVCVAC